MRAGLKDQEKGTVLMRRNKAAWTITGVFILIVVLAVFLTPRGRDMNAAPGTLVDQPDPAAQSGS